MLPLKYFFSITWNNHKSRIEDIFWDKIGTRIIIYVLVALGYMFS